MSPEKDVRIEDQENNEKQENNGDEEKDIEIEIHLTDGQIFKVKKSILVKKSPIFEAMFQYNTVEKKTNSVKISGYNSKIIQKFLGYFVTNELKDSEDVEDIFRLANYYQVSGLKDLCLQIIYSCISFSNIKKFFKLAKEIELTELKWKCINFLLESMTSSNIVDIYKFSKIEKLIELKKKCVEFICGLINLKNFHEIYEFGKKEELNDLIDRVISFIKSNMSGVMKSNEWQKFGIEFQHKVYESFVEKLASNENGELLSGEINLSILHMIDDGRERLHTFFDRQIPCYEKTLILKNTGKTRVAFKIASNSNAHCYFEAVPSVGFLEPDEETQIQMTFNVRQISAHVMYEVSEEKANVDCFKGSSFVRQIEIDLNRVLLPGDIMDFDGYEYYSESDED